MKVLPLALGLSVAANLALLVAAMRPSAVGMGTSGGTGGANEPARAGVNARAGLGGDAAAAGAAWTSLSAGTLEEMVHRLRLAGYPIEAIRAIVRARIKEQLKSRQQELLSSLETPPYWRLSTGFNTKLNAAQRELEQEASRLMREALGPDATDDSEFALLYRKRQYGDLSPQKLEEVQRIATDYNDLRGEIYAESNGMIMPEDREKLTYLEKEMRSDIAKLLTPEEQEMYELRSGSVASLLRSQLASFQPSEEEFRLLFRAARSIEDQFGVMQPGMGGDAIRQRQAAMSDLAKQALAPARYDEFVQATDPRYSLINRVATRYALPASVVPQVYAVQQDIQKRAGAARNLPPAERAAQLAALQAEATTKLAPLLGDRALEAYMGFGGQWLQQLLPPAPPAPKKS